MIARLFRSFDLSVLIGSSAAAGGADSLKGEQQFCGLSEIVKEVFKISGFKIMFKTFKSIAAATCQ